MLSSFISVVLNGVFIGGLYGLCASAWSFQVGALRYANFAYGSSIIFSMYLTFFMIRMWNIPLVLSIILVLLFNFCLGFIMRKTVLKGNRQRMIVCTMALSLILLNVLSLSFTNYPREFGVLEKRFFITENISIGSIQVICFIMSLVILFSFQYFLKKTWLGRAIRAVVQNSDVAMLMGIKSERIMDLAYSVSYMLVGCASIMLLLLYQAEPSFGAGIQTIAFMVCVLAGLGNISGAFFSGIILGVLQGVLGFVLGSQFLNPMIYTLFVIMLLVKPKGIFTKMSNVARSI